MNKVGWLDGDDPVTEAADTIFGPLEKPPIGRVHFDGKTMYIKASKPRNPFLHLANLDEPQVRSDGSIVTIRFDDFVFKHL